MKRKRILKEGVQIPYRLDDFKPGDRIHIIGEYDSVSFDNFATVIATNNDIDNPYSDDASILVRVDSATPISDLLHGGGTGNPEIAKKCRGNCFWIGMYEFNPEYNYENYRVNYDENRVIKLNDNLPNTYDVITSLYESKVLTESRFIYPSVEVGDEVIVSFDYTGENPFSVRNEFATVLEINYYDHWTLLEFKDWHKGHDGHYQFPGHCRSNNCFFVSDTNEYFDNLDVRPANIPNAYDVITSLYESEDFDWAMDMAKNIEKNLVDFSMIPKERNGYYNVILLDKPGIAYETIANIVDYINEKTSWISTLDGGDIKDIYNNYIKKGFSYINLRPNNSVTYGSSEDTFLFLYDMDFSDPQVKVIRPYSYNETIKESEEEEFDWAMDMAKDIENRGLKVSEIPTKMNGYYNVILFDKPGITIETIKRIVDYISKNTEWKFSSPESVAEDIYHYYMQDNKETYINLKPEYRYPGGPGSVSFGHGEGVFTRSNDRNFSNPSVIIIRPY